MTLSTFAGLLLLLFAGGFLAIVTLMGGRITRDELWVVLAFIGGGLLLLDPADMRALLTALIERMPWAKKGD
jgi:hypothetical protein